MVFAFEAMHGRRCYTDVPVGERLSPRTVAVGAGGARARWSTRRSRLAACRPVLGPLIISLPPRVSFLR